MRLEYCRGSSHKFYEVTLRLSFQTEVITVSPVYLQDIYRVRALCDQCRSLSRSADARTASAADMRAYDQWADGIVGLIRDEGVTLDRVLLNEMYGDLYVNQVTITGDARWGRVGARGRRNCLTPLCRPTNPPWNIAASCIGRLASKREEKIDKGYEVVAWNEGEQGQSVDATAANTALRQAASAINQQLKTEEAAATLTEAARLLEGYEDGGREAWML